MEQQFSPSRSRATSKPHVVCPPVLFYECGCCKNLFQQLTGWKIAPPQCCNQKMSLLEVVSPQMVKNEVKLDYKIMGGYNENVVVVEWEIQVEDLAVKWIYLKTFTGGMIKYVDNLQKKSFRFALADEDSYVYCDEDPCLECTFRCKRGFEIYILLTGNKLVKLPLDKMTANWHS